MIKCKEEYPLLLQSINAKIGAEIGVLRGDFSNIILKNWDGRKLYLIDCWRDNPNALDEINQDHNIQLDNYAYTFMNTYFFYHRCCIIKELSTEAACFFKDESLDFVYIDAAHDYLNVTNDLNSWYPKVKKGGIVSGHDYVNGIWSHIDDKDITRYTRFEVKDAVDNFFESLGYIVKSTKNHPECTETHPTWWVIK